ncbi:MAG: N-acetyl-alpha-D-glucosaminyl L-malate synthase BshA [Bacteroidota bacterium]
MELGKALAEKGHKIHFITYNRPIRLDLFSENIFYHQVRTKDYPLFDFVPYESALASQMVDVARYHDLDLFHVHYAVPHASVAYLAKQILQNLGKYVPVITTLHGTDITLVGKNQAYEPVVTFSMAQSDGLTAVSDFLRQATQDNFHIQKPIEVIPNFVDLDRFHRQNKDHFRKLITTGGQKVLIHTSNFRKVKRIGDVIKTFEKVRERIPARLLMVGDGPERNRAEEMCRELGLCDDIYFLGSQNSVEEIYAIGDVFLLPSENESFGLSALEAMACGVPVITSDAGGLPEVNIHGQTGFISPVGDVAGMATNTLKLLQNEDSWQKFSQAAFDHSQQFSVEKIVPAYERYYEAILSSAKVAQP